MFLLILFERIGVLFEGVFFPGVKITQNSQQQRLSRGVLQKTFPLKLIKIHRKTPTQDSLYK